ncbi:MAG: DUF6607 family protein [Pseudomonadota bacterium]
MKKVKLLTAVLMISGCAVQPTTTEETSATDKTTEKPPRYTQSRNYFFDKISGVSSKQEMDRAAVLAMQGEYKVGFHFEETVVLQNGYQRHKPKDSGAFETVVVVSEQPNHIVLQHILVSSKGAHVIKHWRQDWTYEAPSRFEFVADQTWDVVPLDDQKTKGAWTQCVYEVSDAPRYCGTGRWQHKNGVSTWTSDRSWRPLPRREYTTRSDYNALNVENRHTVTPLGWTHEQDNTKTVRDGERTTGTLVREFGFNDYRRVDGFDFKPAYEYWHKTSDYWAKVRNAWTKRFEENKRVMLKTEVDGMPIIAATFGHASEIQNDLASPGHDEIEAVLTEWVGVVN